jgi:hypothetical protein
MNGWLWVQPDWYDVLLPSDDFRSNPWSGSKSHFIPLSHAFTTWARSFIKLEPPIVSTLYDWSFYACLCFRVQLFFASGSLFVFSFIFSNQQITPLDRTQDQKSLSSSLFAYWSILRLLYDYHKDLFQMFQWSISFLMPSFIFIKEFAPFLLFLIANF